MTQAINPTNISELRACFMAAHLVPCRVGSPARTNPGNVMDSLESVKEAFPAEKGALELGVHLDETRAVGDFETRTELEKLADHFRAQNVPVLRQFVEEEDDFLDTVVLRVQLPADAAAFLAARRLVHDLAAPIEPY